MGVTLHELLSQLEWSQGIPWDQLEFLVVDRGAPGDLRLVRSPEVVGRDRSYLHLAGGGRVPYHRVVEVRASGRVVWSRDGVARDRGAQ